MYQIAILRHAYYPDLQGVEAPKIHADDRNDPVEYDTVDEAKDVIAEWDNEVYVLSHNESGRPSYLVVEAVDGDYIHGGRYGDMSNYDWAEWESYCTHNDDDACGECHGCHESMIAEDRDYLLGRAVYTS